MQNFGIGRITTSGTITRYSASAISITNGPDGALWFTGYDNYIGRITTAGTVSKYAAPTANSGLGGIATGPDGALWFTEETGFNIGRATVVQPNTFFLPWEQSATPAENYWQFADGNPFGYYSVLEGSGIGQTALLDHADLG